VNFNLNFNVLLRKYIVHTLVKIKETLIILRCTVQLRKKKNCIISRERRSNFGLTKFTAVS
jgi:hypothetical protein